MLYLAVREQKVANNIHLAISRDRLLGELLASASWWWCAGDQEFWLTDISLASLEALRWIARFIWMKSINQSIRNF